VNLGLVGCGGMGRRHLHGIAELQRVQGTAVITLSGITDRVPARAAALADEAERLLGRRPAVFADQDALVRAGVAEAVDINTATESHADLCCSALAAGLHVFVEKPLAVTIADCRRVQRAAARAGRIVGVAENVRREAGQRLAHAAVAAGLIGEVRIVVDQVCAGADAIWLTPWRHRKVAGGMLLDVMVHHADLMEYLAGPVDRVAGRIRLVEPVRWLRGGPGPVSSAAYYEQWTPELPPRAEADAEDEAVAVLQFRNGAMGTWTISQAAHGEASRVRWIYGSKGSLRLPPDRSGRSPVFTPDGEGALEGALLVDAVPAYRLDDISAAVYGDDRPVPLGMPFAEIDRKLCAIEIGDFIRAVQRRSAPEVDAVHGTRNIALVWAVCEASVAGTWVDVAEVERGDRASYQQTLGHR